MKKVLLMILISFFTINVYAEEGLFQLIPVNQSSTVETEHFIYKGIYYNDNDMQAEYLNSNHVIIPAVKNKTEEELPVSISIGMFDKDQVNIGVVNYCGTKEKITFADQTIKGEAEIPYSIAIMSTDLTTGKKMQDVEYIAVLGENESCSTIGKSKYEGKTVEEIKEMKANGDKKEGIDKNTEVFLYIVIGVVGFFLVMFLSRFLMGGGKSREDRIREQYRMPPSPPKPNPPEEPPVEKKEETPKPIPPEEEKKEDPSDLRNMFQ